GDVGIREQCVHGGESAAEIGHGGGGFGEGAFFLVVSAGAFGTGTTSTPCASPLTPLKFVLCTRTRYFAPAASGFSTWTTTRSYGTGRCASSLRTRAVSSLAVVSVAPRPPRTGGRAEGGGGAGLARAVSLRAVVSRWVVSCNRFSESATARARA